jgi:hypothetical protein
MKKYVSIGATALLLIGCAPKMGEDILIQPEGNVRLESSSNAVMLGVLALIGAPVERGAICIGTDVKVINKWHSDITLVSLDYTLRDGEETIAQGEAKTELLKPLVIASGTQKIIPLTFRIEPERLTPNRILGIVQSKRKLIVKGDAVIKVWGMEKHYPFEKETTKLVQKSLRGAL